MTQPRDSGKALPSAQGAAVHFTTRRRIPVARSFATRIGPAIIAVALCLATGCDVLDLDGNDLSVAIDRRSLTLAVGDTVLLDYTVFRSSSRIFRSRFTSKDAVVASAYTDGLVIGRGPGTTVVSVLVWTDEDAAQDSIPVTVTLPGQ